MADRFPLIANTSANQIQELSASDNLDLTGNSIIGVSTIGVSTVTASTVTATSSTVGSAVTMSESGIDVTGIVTSTSFSGSGASLTSIPAANIVGLATAGFERSGGFGGITDMDAWAISSNYSVSSGSNTITTNWYQFSTASNTHFPKKGDSMSQSSGIWTFPKTGFWTVDFMFGCYNVDNNSGTYFGFQMFFSTDTGGSYDRFYTAYGNMTDNNDHGELFVRAYIDVTNVSTNRLKFNTNMAASKTVFGDADEMRTGAIFTRIGDT